MHEQTIKNIMKQILRGLDALHSVGLVHRDIKPANILTLDQTFVVSDFG
jgi:serine/threonine-protein kinase